MQVRLRPDDRVIERVTRCAFGLVIFGLGIAAIVRAELGLAPWDVFHQGVADRIGLGIGVVIILTSLVVVGLWWPLEVTLGLGTIMNATMIGATVDLSLPLIPDLESLVTRWIALLGGVVLIAVGSGFYIGAGLGPGPRDGLMTGLAERGWSIRLARTLVELSALVIGMLLGGTAGVGTLVFALGIGPLAQFFIPRLSMRPTSGGSTRAAFE